MRLYHAKSQQWRISAVFVASTLCPARRKTGFKAVPGHRVCPGRPKTMVLRLRGHTARRYGHGIVTLSVVGLRETAE